MGFWTTKSEWVETPEIPLDEINGNAAVRRQIDENVQRDRDLNHIQAGGDSPEEIEAIGREFHRRYPQLVNDKELLQECIDEVNDRIDAGERNCWDLYEKIAEEMIKEYEDDPDVPNPRREFFSQPHVQEQMYRSGVIRDMARSRISVVNNTDWEDDE